MSIALTDRDRRLIHAAWSLGAATHTTLRALVTPETRANTLRRRLRLLHTERYLIQRQHVGPAGCLWLYSAGPRGLRSTDARPWRPSLAQIEHTVAVGYTIVALTRPGFVPGLHVTGWQGEAELRSWAAPGEPFPDARITWEHGGASGAWLVEVDRGTESRSAWRRKLVRYLISATTETVLAVTTTQRRAAGLAAVAADIGVDLIATTIEDVVRENPDVVDVRTGTRVPLSEAGVRRGRTAAVSSRS
ncbi:MAG TPA: replication-relaxation family protein [Frankiaceae bacterium]|nr:replication-relaxation family protein [Frankiaceae bacterium]